MVSPGSMKTPLLVQYRPPLKEGDVLLQLGRRKWRLEAHPNARGSLAAIQAQWKNLGAGGFRLHHRARQRISTKLMKKKSRQLGAGVACPPTQ